MTVIDDYLSRLPVPERAELERVRRIIKQAVPQAEEVISYAMPGLKYKGRYLAGFDAHKNHLALYPTARPIVALKDKLVGFDLTKGAIHFTLDKPLPDTLIKEIARFRVADIDSR